MRTSSIRLRANARLAILHEDYLEICDGNMLAAMLLSVLVYWTDIKIAKKEESRWIWKTHEDFQEDLLFNRGMKAPHRTTISSALDTLKAKGFIQWRKNPKLALDRTRQYLVNLEAVQAEIDRLPSLVSRKSDNGMSENRHSTEQASEDASDSLTNVGITTYGECRETDNALSEKQHCNVEKPTSNTIDYSTEITTPEITGNDVVSAIAENDAPANVYHFEAEKKRITNGRIPVVSGSQSTIGNDDEEDISLAETTKHKAMPKQQTPAVGVPLSLAVGPQTGSQDDSPDVQAPSPSPGTDAAQRTANPPGDGATSSGAVQASSRDEKPPMALTAKQIEKQLQKRQDEILALYASKIGRKPSRSKANLDGALKLAQDDASDEDISTTIDAILADSFLAKNLSLTFVHSKLDALARKPIPIENKQNGKAPTFVIDEERNRRNIEAMKARNAARRLAANG